jgi:pimeloyl-ACP methyl ester carboxylesterase
MSFVDRFFAGLSSLSNRPGVFRHLTWQFKKYYADERTVKLILKKMFASCKLDIDLIDGKASIPPIYSWFVRLYQNSIPGTADDFKYVMGKWWRDLAEIRLDILFVHGGEDPLIKADAVKSIIERNDNVALKVVPDAGHHLIITHLDEILRLINKR